MPVESHAHYRAGGALCGNKRRERWVVVPAKLGPIAGTPWSPRTSPLSEVDDICRARHGVRYVFGEFSDHLCACRCSLTRTRSLEPSLTSHTLPVFTLQRRP